MTKQAKLIAAGLIGLALIAGLGYAAYYLVTSVKKVAVHSYFTYTQADIVRLKNLHTTSKITSETASKELENILEFVKNHQIIDIDAAKLYAYATAAQLDAAAISLQAHGALQGDLAVVSKGVICELYKNNCSEILAENADEYSITLTDIIVAKIKERIENESHGLKDSPLKSGADYWNSPAPAGRSAASFKPWLIRSADQFRPSVPPDINSTQMHDQLAQVKQKLATISIAQKAQVVQWTGGPGTNTLPGQWLHMANQQMLVSKMPVETFLQARATLAMAMADTITAVFDAKYTYQQKHPNMLDPSIVTIMPTPNHPSYPSSHAGVSWAATIVLTHYLPGHQQMWEEMATAASESRVLSGIHFPVDIQAGEAIGRNIGSEVVRIQP